METTGPVVLVVGGYGAVGAELCRDLARHGLPVVIAGRTPARAEALAQETGGSARRLDLADPATWPAAVAGIDLVVACMDQQDTGFVQFLFERGIRYADITASDALFRALAALPRPERASALLSVGLAPGLTNLLAADCAAALDRVEAIEIGLLFGLGDPHGAAGLDWMASTVFSAEAPPEPGNLDFGPPWGHRTAYRVDFSDQWALRRTYKVPTATRVAFDSRLSTWALFGLARAFPGSRIVQRLARASFSAIRIGSVELAVVVRARGRVGTRRAVAAVRFLSRHESLTTARLSSLMLRHYLAGPMLTGVHHSHEILPVAELLGAITREGIGQLTRPVPDLQLA